VVAGARAFFAVTGGSRSGRVVDAAGAISTSDYYEDLALSRAIDTIGAARRGIAVAALAGFGKTDDSVAAWLESGGTHVARTRERLQALTESGEITVSRLSVAAGLMSDLAAS
jgi:glutamate dehydrogenase